MWNRKPFRAALVLLVLIALSVPAFAASGDNRLRFTYGRSAPVPSEFFDAEKYVDVVGGNYERKIGKAIGFQFDAYRLRDEARSWAGAVDLALHAGAFVFQVGPEYFYEPDLWGVNVGAGVDHCGEIFCAQFVARYHKKIETGTDSTLGFSLAEGYDVSAQAGLGFKW